MGAGLREHGLVQGHDRLTARLARSGVPAPAIESLLSRYTLVRYPRGSVVFAKGAPADLIFAVFSGIVKVATVTRGGERVVFALAGPGDLAGFADFSDGPERSQLFDAETLTGSVIALFTRDHIRRVMRELEPDAILGIAENLNSLWSSIAHRSAQFLGMTLRERLEAIMAELAGRFGIPEARGIMLMPELAQEDLAEMIGGSRPMVSKLLIEMVEQKLIARQGRRYILMPHPKALWKMTVLDSPAGSESRGHDSPRKAAEDSHAHTGSARRGSAHWPAVRAESRRG